MRTVAKILAIAFLLYACACVALFQFQRSLIYFPQSRMFGGIDTTLTLPVTGANLVVSMHPHTGRKALIYFGGNAEDVSANLALFSTAFSDYAIYLLHYRGYGGSSGTPSEEAIHADARALFDKVCTQHPDIAVVGRSLGSGVAIRLANERPVSRLVLVTPYDSIQELAAEQFPYFPVRWLLTEKFESWRYAPTIQAPTLLLLAENDEVIPRKSSERLNASFAKGIASLIVIRGVNHNTISNAAQYMEAMRSAL